MSAEYQTDYFFYSIAVVAEEAIRFIIFIYCMIPHE